MSPADPPVGGTGEPGDPEPNGEPNGHEPLAFGVPAGALVDALRGAGMADPDVIAVVGRAIARSAGMTAAATATPPFVFHTKIAQTAPECAMTFQRAFLHPDFIDGVTVVQAGAAPEEIGFNQRFHTIETDLDNIAHDLHTAGNCMAELRLELFGMAQELQAKITEIDSRLDAKAKDKDKEKDTKEGKEKDTKESKEKDTKESKDKEGKDGKDAKDKDTKDHKDKDKEKEIQKDGHGKEFVDLTNPIPAGFTLHPPSDPATGEPAADEGEERTFIRLEDRPEVGRAALAESDEDSTGGETGGGG
jgi:hypothetical protein